MNCSQSFGNTLSQKCRLILLANDASSIICVNVDPIRVMALCVEVPQLGCSGSFSWLVGHLLKKKQMTIT